MLFIFDTHPIQYRSPVFRELAKRMDVKIWFFSQSFNSRRWWLHEKDKIPKQVWGIDLEQGFAQETMGAKNLLSFFLKAFQILRRERPKAILIYGYFLPENWILVFLSRMFGISCLFIGETFPRKSKPARQAIKNLVLPFFFRRVSKIISIGKHSESFYKQYGVEETNLIKARYATDVSFFTPSQVEKPVIRKHLGVSAHKFTLLFVGRLVSRKRPFDMVALHELCLSWFPDQVQTIVIGNGELEPELYRRSSKYSDFYMVGFKNQKEIRDYYEASDLLVVPSEYETWGLVTNEAMAMGVPALVTDQCGAANDLVIDGETGWVYPVGEVQTAFEKISSVIRNREQLSQISKKAKLVVTEQFSISQFAEKIEDAYRNVSGEHNIQRVRMQG